MFFSYSAVPVGHTPTFTTIRGPQLWLLNKVEVCSFEAFLLSFLSIVLVGFPATVVAQETDENDGKRAQQKRFK